MVRQFVNKYFIKEFYSIEINNGDFGTEYRLIYLKRKATQLFILEQTIYKDEAIFKKLKKDIPIIIVFSGKRIISKVVSNEANYLQKILFNKDPDSYYVQEYFKGEKILISIARKNDIDEYFEKFNTYNLYILDFSLGPFLLESLSHLLGERKVFNTSDFIYNPLENELKIKDIATQEDENYTIGDDTILNKHILAFAGFLSYLQPENFIKNFRNYTHKQIESFSYRIAFEVLGKSVLVLFLILLTLSYALKSHYVGKSSEIQQESILNSQILNEIATLKTDRDYKKNIISNSSLGSNDFLSFYISEMAKELPEDILLTEIQVYPSKTSNNPNEKISIESNTIILEGITPSKLSVNKWVDILDDYKWIKKVELLSYTFEKNEYVFKLNITL